MKTVFKEIPLHNFFFLYALFADTFFLEIMNQIQKQPLEVFCKKRCS